MMRPAMATRPPALRGDLGDGGVLEVFRRCEARRVTGVLRYFGTGPDEGVEGEVRLFGGEIAVDQASRDDGQDPVDVFLDLESGRWEIAPSLPPLPVSRGTELQRTGSLAVHVPVDLMSYCEQAGLTGVLELTHEGRKAEAVYEGGELLAIELDGRDATDLHEVFAWEQGRFKISLDLEAPDRLDSESEIELSPGDDWAPAPPQKRENTRQFLRVVEMALVDVLDRSEKARSPTRTSPPLPPPPKARPRPPVLPPPSPRGRADQTVRLVYLTAEPSPVKRDEPALSTRHVRSDVSAEKVGAPAAPEERNPMAKKRKGARSPKPASKPAEPKATAPKAAASNPAPSKAASEAVETKPAPKAVEPSGASKPSPAPPPGETGLVGALKQAGLASAWALAVVVLGLAILFVLGKLPPVQ